MEIKRCQICGDNLRAIKTEGIVDGCWAVVCSPKCRFDSIKSFVIEADLISSYRKDYFTLSPIGDP